MNENTIEDLLRTQNETLSEILETLREQARLMQFSDPDDGAEGSPDELPSAYEATNIQRFVAECLVRYTDRQIASEQVASVFRAWCAENDLSLGRTRNRVNQSTLSRSLAGEGIQSVRPTSVDGTRSRVYLGIGLSAHGRNLT